MARVWEAASSDPPGLDKSRHPPLDSRALIDQCVALPHCSALNHPRTMQVRLLEGEGWFLQLGEFMGVRLPFGNHRAGSTQQSKG